MLLKICYVKQTWALCSSSFICFISKFIVSPAIGKYNTGENRMISRRGTFRITVEKMITKLVNNNHLVSCSTNKAF